MTVKTVLDRGECVASGFVERVPVSFKWEAVWAQRRYSLCGEWNHCYSSSL